MQKLANLLPRPDLAHMLRPTVTSTRPKRKFLWNTQVLSSRNSGVYTHEKKQTYVPPTVFDGILFVIVVFLSVDVTATYRGVVLITDQLLLSPFL